MPHSLANRVICLVFVWSLFVVDVAPLTNVSTQIEQPYWRFLVGLDSG
jgi:hypothetical protein